MNLSPHFLLSEFTQSQTARRLGIDNTPPPDVIENLKRTAMALEAVRTILGKPIIISSGYRSPRLNKAIKGASKSQHVTGHAVDFICPAYGTPAEIVKTLLRTGMVFDQLILEFPPDGWVHMSVTEKPRNQALIIDKSGTRAYT